MRKALAVLFCMLIFTVLPACSSASAKAADIVFAFTCSAQVTTQSGTVSCTVTRAAPQSASITVQSPEEISGMTYTWGDNFIISYAGLVTKSSECSLPKSSFAAQLIGVLDAASMQDALTVSGNSAFTGIYDNAAFTLTVDSKSGYIQQIEIPRYGIKATLSNYKSVT